MTRSGEWNYAVPMTFPESDAILGEKLVKTGLSRSAAWEATANSERIAEGCNATLLPPKDGEIPDKRGGSQSMVDITADDLLWEWLRYGWNFRNYGSRPITEQQRIIGRIKYRDGYDPQ